MDDNKLNKLRDIRYTMRQCCGTCKHRHFEFRAEWGTCNLFTYEHKKHTGEPRNLSIHMYGTCYEYEMENLHEEITKHCKEFYE